MQGLNASKCTWTGTSLLKTSTGKGKEIMWIFCSMIHRQGKRYPPSYGSGGWFGRIGTRKSKWRLWRTYKSTVEDSAFQLQSLTHPSPIKTNLDILPSPLKKQSVLTLHMYFASVWNTKSGAHLWILTREATKIQSYGYVLLSERKLPSLWVRVKRFLALKFQLPVLIV